MIIRRIINSKEFIKIKQDPILILTLPIALILTLFFIAIRPFFLIKIGLLHSDRIGHFALNTELYICEKLYFNKKGVDFFYYPTKPCNTQLAKIIERNLVVIPKIIARPFDLIFRKFEFLNAHRTRNLKGDYDVHNLIDKFPTQLNFTNEEYKEGNKILKKHGYENQKIVLFIIRDDSYLKSIYRSSKFVSNYHSHRDDNIKNYEDAMIYLAKKGYLVLRMGKKVKKKISIRHKNIVDYPFCKFKSDFMDIFLAKKCFFGVTNLTGYDALFVIFRKPMLCLGSLPIGCMFSSSKNYMNTVYYHYSKKLKRNLSLTEIFEKNLAFSFSRYDFDNKAIKIIKFKSDEIKEYVIDMLKFVKRKPSSKKNKFNTKANLLYRFLINKYDTNKRYHGKIKSYFSNYFLKKNFKSIIR